MELKRDFTITELPNHTHSLGSCSEDVCFFYIFHENLKVKLLNLAFRVSERERGKRDLLMYQFSSVNANASNAWTTK